MAIFKDVEITIQVEGQALREYDDTDEDDQKEVAQRNDAHDAPLLMSKYVEAVSGARFAISVVVPQSVKAFSDALGFELLVNGLPVGSKDMFMSMRLPNLENGVWSRCKEGSTKVTKAGTVMRPFVFSDIKSSDDSSASPRKPQGNSTVDDLGTIVVKAWRKKIRRRTRKEKKTTEFEEHLTNQEEVHEKELKRQIFDAYLGEEEKARRNPRFCNTDYVDGVDYPFAIFTFKYCLKKALQSLLFIPQTPSPTPTPPPVPLEDRPVDELTMEELRELARQQQARFQAERDAKVNAELGIKSEVSLTAEKGIKSERGIKRERDAEMDELLASASAKRVKGPIMNGEIVDLSN